MTLRSNPEPTFTVQLEGQDVRYSNTVLLGDKVIFKNTTLGSGECEWNFGEGASIVGFKGCSPPSVSYSTAGAKTPSLKITESGCSGETILASYYFKIVSCNPKIPSYVQIVREGVEIDGPNDVILVCPGPVYETRSHSRKGVYVETGGTFILGYIGESTAFATKGSVVSITSNYGNVIYEEAASVTGNPEIKLLCPSVSFDYALVKCKCNEDCNAATIAEPIAPHRLTIFPNPSQGNFRIDGVDEAFSLTIYNAHGNQISEESFTVPNVQLNLIAGFYMIKVTDSKGVRMAKLNISK